MSSRKREKEPPLACKCKVGRCVVCRQCPRSSCQNRCSCPSGPTRLRLPVKRKHVAATGMLPGTATTEIAAVGETRAAAVLSPGEAIKPLECPEDVIEAFQLTRRQIMTRFQRRRIAKEGMDSFRENATAFDKACCKRTVQMFQEGVEKLARVLLPEAPEYLVSTGLPRPKEVDLLKQVVEKSPRKSIQSRTARAILAAALTRNERDVMTKYGRKVALKDWRCLREGVLLDSNRDKEEEKGNSTRGNGKKRESSAHVSSDADSKAKLLTIEQEAQLAMMKTMVKTT